MDGLPVHPSFGMTTTQDIKDLFKRFASYMTIIYFQGKDELHYYAVPVVLVCLFAFFIAHCFLTIYEVWFAMLRSILKVLAS